MDMYVCPLVSFSFSVSFFFFLLSLPLLFAFCLLSLSITLSLSFLSFPSFVLLHLGQRLEYVASTPRLVESDAGMQSHERRHLSQSLYECFRPEQTSSSHHIGQRNGQMHGRMVPGSRFIVWFNSGSSFGSSSWGSSFAARCSEKTALRR
jgi:hypothetical protein